MKKISLLCLALTLGSWAQTISGVPREFSYQAFVKDAAGNLVAPDRPQIFEITVRLFANETEVANEMPLWAERQAASIFQGRLSLVLGQGTVVPGVPERDFTEVFENPRVFAEVSFKDLNDVSAVEQSLQTRQEIVAVPTALRAAVADQLRPGLVLTSAELRDGSFDAAPFAASAVLSGKLAPDSLAATEIAANSVSSSLIDAGAVRTNHVVDGVIESSDLQGGLASGQFATGAVTSAKIQNGTLVGSDFPTGVSGASFQDASLTEADFSFPFSRFEMSDSSVNDSVYETIFGTGQRTISIPAGILPADGVQVALFRVGSIMKSEAHVIVFPGSDHLLPTNLIAPIAANCLYVPRYFSNETLWIDPQGNPQEGSNNGSDNREDLLPYTQTIHCPVERQSDGSYDALIYIADPTSAANNWQPASVSTDITISVIGYY